MSEYTQDLDAAWLAGQPVSLPVAEAPYVNHPEVHALNQTLEQLRATRYWTHLEPDVAAACREAVAAIADEIRHHTDTHEADPTPEADQNPITPKETVIMAAGETTITVIGNLTNDPELRFTPSGSAVANFTVASTPRTFDRQSNEWKDGETLFLRASIWREAAENVAESLTKGMRVIVSGRLKSRTYETKEGEKRTVIELEADEIGPSLRFASAKVNRNNRPAGQVQDQRPAQYRPQQDDTWAAHQDPFGTQGGDAEPPF